MDYDWINVAKIEYFIWLKADNRAININDGIV